MSTDSINIYSFVNSKGENIAVSAIPKEDSINQLYATFSHNVNFPTLVKSRLEHISSQLEVGFKKSEPACFKSNDTFFFAPSTDSEMVDVLSPFTRDTFTLPRLVAGMYLTSLVYELLMSEIVEDLEGEEDISIREKLDDIQGFLLTQFHAVRDSASDLASHLDCFRDYYRLTN